MFRKNIPLFGSKIFLNLDIYMYKSRRTELSYNQTNKYQVLFKIYDKLRGKL